MTRPARKKSRASISGRATKRTNNSSSRKHDDVSEEDTKYTVVYKTKKAKKAKKPEGTTNDEENGEMLRVSETGVEDLEKETEYTVEPLGFWDLKAHTAFEVYQTRVAVNDFVYINHNDVGGTPGEVEDLENKHFWVGKVLEIRANDTSEVFLRIFWCYWPEDLPGGRQPHHGENEIIVSNHMDFVNASTVSSPVKVNRWVEKDDEEDLDGLYWRQSFNYMTSQLSHIRNLCACNQPENPDKRLILCHRCMVWHHRECLIADIKQKQYEKDKPLEEEKEASSPTTATTADQDGDGSNKTDGDEPNSTIQIQTPGEDSTIFISPSKPKMAPAAKRKRGRPSMAKSNAPTSAELDLLYDVEIFVTKEMSNTEERDVTEARITRNRPKEGQETEWRQEIVCLSCKAKM